jgi:hypothetical protein
VLMRTISNKNTATFITCPCHLWFANAHNGSLGCLISWRKHCETPYLLSRLSYLIYPGKSNEC